MEMNRSNAKNYYFNPESFVLSYCIFIDFSTVIIDFAGGGNTVHTILYQKHFWFTSVY